MRAVLDSSVLVSAFIRPASFTANVLGAARLGKYKLCLSDAILRETQRVLSRPRKLAEYGHTRAAVEQYVSGLATVALVVTDLPDIAPVCRDPDDDHVLAAALAAQADVIVTGDADLLAVGTYRGMRVLTVRDFLEAL